VANILIWIDYFILGTIAVSAFIGLWRGLLKESISLASWLSALMVTLVFGDSAAAYMAHSVHVTSVQIILAFGVLFLGILMLGGLINLSIAQWIRTVRLTGAERCLGTLLGALRGMLFIIVLVLLAGLTSFLESSWWKHSSLLPYFQLIAKWLWEVLPPNLAEHFHFP
jgi:membrane protein required for colicin V production